MTLTDVLHHLRAHVATHPTQKAAAEALGVSQQYLNDVLTGKRTPGPKLLAGLGLVRIIEYRPKEDAS